MCIGSRKPPMQRRVARRGVDLELEAKKKAGDRLPDRMSRDNRTMRTTTRRVAGTGVNMIF